MRKMIRFIDVLDCIFEAMARVLVIMVLVSGMVIFVSLLIVCFGAV